MTAMMRHWMPGACDCFLGTWAAWNRELTHKGMTDAGREFLREALTAMGCPSRTRDILCVADLIDFDEGRIPGFSVRPEATDT